MTSLDLFKLDGKTAVVTGGSKGIGLYYSEALVQAGARVVVADIDPKAVEETCARLGREKPDSVLGVDLDVTRRDSVRAMIRRVEERWGRLDILVNNAGLFAVLPMRDDPWGIPDEEWDRVMTVNIRGIYACTAEALPLMRRNPWGRVINISSGLAFKGSAPLIHYAASKGAVVNLTRSMARALGNTGITVNSLAPGATASPTLLAIRPDGDATGQGRPSRIIERTEIPEDLIGALLFLASPASDFMTGQTIVVDGGSYLH
jgi:NAD(P)-dependent dehydrogenase (short-subunit alcohol dehydrogenase family)